MTTTWTLIDIIKDFRLIILFTLTYPVYNFFISISTVANTCIKICSRMNATAFRTKCIFLKRLLINLVFIDRISHQKIIYLYKFIISIVFINIYFLILEEIIQLIRTIMLYLPDNIR